MPFGLLSRQLHPGEANGSPDRDGERLLSISDELGILDVHPRKGDAYCADGAMEPFGPGDDDVGRHVAGYVLVLCGADHLPETRRKVFVVGGHGVELPAVHLLHEGVEFSRPQEEKDQGEQDGPVS